MVSIDLGDLAGEVGKRAFPHAHALAFFVVELGLAARRGLDPVCLRRQEGADLAARQGCRLLALTALADEPGDAGCVAHAVPGLVVHLAANQEVAGEDLALNGLLLAVLELVDFLHGDDDLEDLVLHVHRLDAGVEVGRDLLLVARLGVDDVPLAGSAGGIVCRDRSGLFLGRRRGLLGSRRGFGSVTGFGVVTGLRSSGIVGSLGFRRRCLGLGEVGITCREQVGSGYRVHRGLSSLLGIEVGIAGREQARRVGGRLLFGGGVWNLGVGHEV